MLVSKPFNIPPENERHKKKEQQQNLGHKLQSHCVYSFIWHRITSFHQVFFLFIVRLCFSCGLFYSHTHQRLFFRLIWDILPLIYWNASSHYKVFNLNEKSCMISNCVSRVYCKLLCCRGGIRKVTTISKVITGKGIENYRT